MEADIESGFPGFIPERPAMRIHASRPVSTNSLAFLVTGGNPLYLCKQLWLVVGVFLMATTLRMFATCQQLQAQARAHAAAASGLLNHTELRLHMPPSIAFATRGRLQGLRLQLALLDREFDDLDYDTLRALDSDNASTATSMSEEEINALPVHKHKVTDPEILDGSSLQQASSSSAPVEFCSAMRQMEFGPDLLPSYPSFKLLLKKQDPKRVDGGMKDPEDELTCSICLEQVNGGDLVRSLPCLHQFHANCIDPWLRQQGTCPVCKFRAGSRWPESRESESDGSDMV
ncbi:RING/U-box superfamily protein [Prunus dulcis]|uniref:RING-type E3 ubiquitin transferase n=1 Tax=Prunus dulcis TaxID=3755 RepID=A0A4Y1RM55_PRUDU|nr:RING/U-box superfamily protein [Prunus dulcis]